MAPKRQRRVGVTPDPKEEQPALEVFYQRQLATQAAARDRYFPTKRIQMGVLGNDVNVEVCLDDFPLDQLQPKSTKVPGK